MNQNKEARLFMLDVEREQGRLRTILNGMKWQIKLLHKDCQQEASKLPIWLKLSDFDMQVTYKFDTFLNNAIKYVIFTESKESESDICREVIGQTDIQNNYYFYLEDSVKKYVQAEIMLFVETYINKKTDETIKIVEIKDILNESLRQADEEIDNIFVLFSGSKSCESVYKTYKELIKTAYSRSESNKKLVAFRRALTKAKMNYVMRSQNVLIYPFLYDLLVKSFGLLLQKTFYEESLESAKSFIELNNEFTALRFNKESNMNYLYQDLLNVMQILPDNYMEYKDICTLIIKHYSEVLEVAYNDIAIVLRQLRFEVPDNNKTFYRLPKYLKNQSLNIDDDHFRELSINVL